MTEALQTQDPQPELKKRRGRRPGPRKSQFRMTTPPFPVRALWEAASLEEQKKAHSTGIQLLEHWLGRLTRKELAEKMGLPPLRVWQLSQQALAGMVTGLLKQPRNPPKGTPSPLNEIWEVTSVDLKKENERLQRENNLLKELVDVLKDLPGNRERKIPALEQMRGSGKKTSPSNPLSASPRNLVGKPKESQG